MGVDADTDGIRILDSPVVVVRLGMELAFEVETGVVAEMPSGPEKLVTLAQALVLEKKADV